MKTLGKNSLSSTLSTIINVIWWIEWIFFIALIGVITVTTIIKKEFAVNIPVTFSDITLRQVHGVNSNSPTGVLNTNSGNLYLHVDATWQNVSMLLIECVLIFSIVALITYQLKNIFSSFKKNIPFNNTNIARIRTIAFVLMIYSGVQWLFVIMVNQILISNLKWEHITLTYSFNISCFVTGIVLIVIAEIFKLGYLLDDEIKQTV